MRKQLKENQEEYEDLSYELKYEECVLTITEQKIEEHERKVLLEQRSKKKSSILKRLEQSSKRSHSRRYSQIMKHRKGERIYFKYGKYAYH